MTSNKCTSCTAGMSVWTVHGVSASVNFLGHNFYVEGNIANGQEVDMFNGVVDMFSSLITSLLLFRYYRMNFIEPVVISFLRRTLHL
jgi:hypothetical protein